MPFSGWPIVLLTQVTEVSVLQDAYAGEGDNNIRVERFSMALGTAILQWDDQHCCTGPGASLWSLGCSSLFKWKHIVIPEVVPDGSWFVHVEPVLCQGLLCLGIFRPRRETALHMWRYSTLQESTVQGDGDWLAVHAGRRRRNCS